MQLQNLIYYCNNYYINDIVYIFELLDIIFPSFFNI